MAVGGLPEGNVGLPIDHVARQLGGYADMQVCGYAARRYRVIGHLALWFAPAKHPPWVVVFTSYATWHRASVYLHAHKERQIS